ncbi:alanine/glycine:cation symporter family protein [Vallicoccus soli]|uniref:Alanine:cation symporter family protein n=1 Tax=Vallicoccus soli TaxID=2339232 RepID=A0A3A3ZGJ6_9ACTN|nr:alanine/glycine:cation symporter family protein [Vallicoccus soli]RJK94346.1 alanine:cation symporter family protein [Vallicoccus soli]
MDPYALPALASAPAPSGLDAFIDDNFAGIADRIESVVFYEVSLGDVTFPVVVAWLLLAAVVFTLSFRFVNLRGFKHAIDLVRGKYTRPDEVGEVSHFQALATAVSGTVGLGNIAGVAVAITLGGPGATLWMIVAGLLAMSTKFTECTLGVKYRRVNPDGTVSGGPMFYLSRGLAERRMAGLGKVLAAVFAVFCILGSLGGGNAFQANQAFAQMRAVTGGEDGLLGGGAAGVLFGLLLAAVVGVVIIGGMWRIASVTDKLVPFMAVLYVTACVVVLLANASALPEAARLIVEGAFDTEAVAGGVVGVLIVGVQRAAFSNEAGLGSAPIAHSAVKTDRPVTEGYVALLEPFIDTVVICTMTALTIVVTGAYTQQGEEGVQLTSTAFETVLPWFDNVLALAVVLFAFSTQLAWSYYGAKATAYLSGESRVADTVYKVVFLAFVVIGAAASLGPIIAFSDSMIFAMSIPNLIGVYLLMGVVRRELREHEEGLRTGEVARVDA